ncbi:hypothetical protein H920_12863 [Fukomys damarensis]|uniref:Uncharacterized protein n=1 Tax=Fukomys damarensis TaxID=885580 RepID=A0A091D3Z1_FUKDA|nr:hypothetical protein H920_12863 [Fukomys damarensis]
MWEEPGCQALGRSRVLSNCRLPERRGPCLTQFIGPHLVMAQPIRLWSCREPLPGLAVRAVPSRPADSAIDPGKAASQACAPRDHQPGSPGLSGTAQERSGHDPCPVQMGQPDSSPAGETMDSAVGQPPSVESPGTW